MTPFQQELADLTAIFQMVAEAISNLASAGKLPPKCFLEVDGEALSRLASPTA